MHGVRVSSDGRVGAGRCHDLRVPSEDFSCVAHEGADEVAALQGRMGQVPYGVGGESFVHASEGDDGPRARLCDRHVVLARGSGACCGVVGLLRGGGGGQFGDVA